MELQELKDNMDSQFATLNDRLCGAGSEGKPGMVTRIDRLEQDVVRKRRTTKVMVGAMIALGIETVGRFFGNGS